ncbi:unnamed protein product [Rotaria socialis]|uniref:AIG1-type G domain-containing protein n=1 Tax=Rotaria socialis TaxID=392032 RepID=A0A820HXF1_9BILA|nr:unnamed protein product [Rotaria socialis]CAF3293895.1 unnamed protein product [Rotaria socialis]CAF3486596.1 unnamed protein product [Rotaria socialis]CAF4303281.1 unnamed protein product [Rotaria socialis]CAF4395971.1 unnamed protein product [Rotaria socialis]
MATTEEELRVVLLGKTGNGKSATGNSLLHSRTAFFSTQSAQSITKDCEAKSGTCTGVNGRQKRLVVVDTPGFFDTNEGITNENVQNKIASQIFNMTSPGVHAFLIVVRVDRFTPEEKDTVDFIKKIFGAGAAKYCIVILTREDQLDDGQSIEEFINSSRHLKELVDLCGNRKLAINNKISGGILERKTKDLLQMIDRMVENNNRTYYTNDEYQRIERQRREEQARREEEERRKKKEYEDALKAKATKEAEQKAAKREQEIREEARKNEEKRVQQVRDEERKRTDRQIQEERDRARAAEEEARSERMRSARRQESACGSRRACDGDDDGGGLGAFLNTLRLHGGNDMPSPNTGGMGMSPFQASMPTRHTMLGGGGGGGRFTGEFMATRGSANNRPIMEGVRGGQFYWNNNGNKTYLRK